tara:strand:+ start:59 stop:445 length:387 start_codon:yes stop_codon:yes gene_type:complete
MTDNNYAQSVDYLVSQMKSQSSPTNSQQSFEDYKAQVDKQRQEYANLSIPEMIYDLGYKIDTALGKIISQLDTVLNEEFNPDNVTCSIDDKQVDCNTWEEVNTVNPLTHTVTYNQETNEYKVVKKSTN